MPQTVTYQALQQEELINFLKMKLIFAFAAVLAVASAQFQRFGPQPTRPPLPPVRPTVAARAPVVNRVASSDQAASIIRYDNESGPDGSFNYAFETDNGISAQAQGTPRDFGGNPPVIPVVIEGSFAFTSPEGQPIAITYTADENGYQATGDSIPTPPPIPAAILRALDYLARTAPQKK